jgi:uncharacterized linocin/CFP29 family protein
VPGFPEVKIPRPDAVGVGLLNLPGITVQQVNFRWEDNTFNEVATACSTLNGRGQPGPYALILHPTVFANTSTQGRRQTTSVADRLKQLLADGGFQQSAGLPGGPPPPWMGLLASLGGDPTTIAFAQDPTTEYTQQDASGLHNFRVVERIAVVARETSALIVLQFN